MSRAMSAAELLIMASAISVSVLVMIALVLLAEHQSNSGRSHTGEQPSGRVHGAGSMPVTGEPPYRTGTLVPHLPTSLPLADRESEPAREFSSHVREGQKRQPIGTTTVQAARLLAKQSQR